MQKLNPLGESAHYHFIGGQTLWPQDDSRTAREQFEDEKEEIKKDYDGIRMKMEIDVMRQHLLGIRDRLAKMARHRSLMDCTVRHAKR